MKIINTGEGLNRPGVKGLGRVAPRLWGREIGKRLKRLWEKNEKLEKKVLREIRETGPVTGSKSFARRQQLIRAVGG